ncbi:sodium:proton antiporter [Actinoallomurus soli]|uniref:sodium:proton antiporter n=1 Tax=Actinoallomurus soli TaxID=2952535 RepID=UPI002092CA7E|nr:cation:proton antiporter subunit C [Actinoallomurus soli]MCO5974344.1 cation:proton antiporter subunit C [Actinoallomurus soli]
MSHLPYLAAGWILLAGIFGMVTSRNLVHVVVCLSVTQSATYVLLLAIGYRKGGTAPVFSDIKPTGKVVDPVVQAMTLTDIVVNATATALLLALAVQVAKRRGTIDPDELRPLE